MKDDKPDPDELILSRSEQTVRSSAERLTSGKARPRSTRRTLAAIVLGFELVVVFLTGLTIFGMKVLTPPELGLYGGLVICVIVVVALGTLRWRIGMILGWAVQGILLLSSVILPMAIIGGAVFTALWVYCFVRGGQIDRERESWLHEQDLETN